MKKLDTFYAKTALVLCLGFWIPLFNIGLSAVSVILAMKTLKFVETAPTKYGGRKQAIIALVIGLTTLITSIVWLAIFTLKKMEELSLGI